MPVYLMKPLQKLLLIHRTYVVLASGQPIGLFVLHWPVLTVPNECQLAYNWYLCHYSYSICPVYMLVRVFLQLFLMLGH